MLWITPIFSKRKNLASEKTKKFFVLADI